MGNPGHVPSIDVPSLHTHHPTIRAADWRSPLICRLLQAKVYQDGGQTFADSVRLEDGSVVEGTLNLVWNGLAADFGQTVNTYQSTQITEFATLGLACILVHERAARRITEVTRRGERADYWMGEGLLIEVSGQQNGNLQALRDNKAAQLLANPFGCGGYVCVANYSDRQCYLWFFEQNTKSAR